MLSSTDSLIHCLFIVLPLAVGVALIFVKVNADELRSGARVNPGLALYRFRIFRYGAVILLFIVAAISAFTL